MLNQLSMWQMVIDLSLVTSILVMAFRFTKSSRAQALMPRLAELETRVLALMDDTEDRAQRISEQLIRREQGISRNVADIEKRQRDMELSLNDSDALAKELSLMCESARREAAELERLVVEVRESHRAASQATRAEHSEFVPASRARYSDRDRAPQTRSEQISEERPTPHQQSDMQNSSVKTLQDTYRLAERMLKQGSKPQEVSARTKLSLDGIERLAQMIEIEREEVSDNRARYGTPQPAADPRLGALGMSRR
jgi:hypothetical protein